MSSETNHESIGSVLSVWRYPVKSMLGEELKSTRVTERGLLGDRAYALLDRETAKVASAKHPRKWPSLFGRHWWWRRLRRLRALSKTRGWAERLLLASKFVC